MKQLFIIWPERRVLDARTVRTWFADAKANGELDPEDLEAKDTWEKARALHHAGLITLAESHA